nr:MAG TPA: hypothetical protein [Caudoviricetes sp.]DAX60399.1 MAG TPA: hypothetical protein [Caudoviricetes sp.]
MPVGSRLLLVSVRSTILLLLSLYCLLVIISVGFFNF